MRSSIRTLTIVISVVGAFAGFYSIRQDAQIVQKTAEPPKQGVPEVIILAKESKVGTVTFNHVKHNSGEYTVDGPIRCIECHHVSQPASEAAKHPPLKTVWPADRTTTLTMDLFSKDPKGAAVAKCHDCHARKGETPKLLAAIPETKDAGSTTITTLTNQLAFHQACDSCHIQIKANRPDSKVPDAVTCVSCHKRS
ncbi:MAG: cytochrome c3 family protein [Acidobacteria bacterium]|nr:cytochrome c3 family protein [Acidobacteriota bacterium]MBP7475582.1 cytochrome c3 family protein [Pyrinomonadaceae bacterium]MBP9110683.1 cytochrome c3 family protein [Pyrinomonadaceae bacterium]